MSGETKPVGEDPLAEMALRINRELGLPEHADSVSYLRGIPMEKVHSAMLKVYSTNPDGTWVGGRQPSTAHLIVEDLRKKYGDRIRESDYDKIYETSFVIIFSQNAAASVPYMVRMAREEGPEGDRYRKVFAKMLGAESNVK